MKSWVMISFADEKPGFSEETGFLQVNENHYQILGRRWASANLSYSSAVFAVEL